MKKFALALVLAIISLAIIANTVPRLYHDTAIRRNGEVFSTEVLGLSGSIPWAYFHIEAPQGMICARCTNSGNYCLRAVRNLLQFGRPAQWAPHHLIGETIDVIYYNGSLLYAGSTERARLTANIVFAVLLLGAAGLLFFGGGYQKKAGATNLY